MAITSNYLKTSGTYWLKHESDTKLVVKALSMSKENKSNLTNIRLLGNSSVFMQRI